MLQVASLGARCMTLLFRKDMILAISPKKSDLHCALESNVILGGCTPFYCGRNMPPMYFLCGSSFFGPNVKNFIHVAAWGGVGATYVIQKEEIDS